MFQNIVNGKAYIGKSKNLEYRRNEHLRLLRKNADPCIKLNRAWQLYGEENFNYEVLCYCKESELNDMEVRFIEMYDSLKNGYNCTAGGDGISGYKHSQETKEIIRKMSTGRKHTEESKRKMSEVQKGRIVSESQREAMRAAWTPERKTAFIESRSGENNPNYGRCGEDSCHRQPIICSTGEVFPTLLEAARWCGLRSTGNLCSCCRGARPYCGRHPVTGEKLSWRALPQDESLVSA